MKKKYKRQILDYNVEKFSLIVRDNIDLFSSTEILTQAIKNATLQVNSMSGTEKIREKLKQYIEKSERLKLGHSRFYYNYWYLVEIAVDKASVLRFINALVVFMKQE